MTLAHVYPRPTHIKMMMLLDDEYIMEPPPYWDVSTWSIHPIFLTVQHNQYAREDRRLKPFAFLVVRPCAAIKFPPLSSLGLACMYSSSIIIDGARQTPLVLSEEISKFLTYHNG